MTDLDSTTLTHRLTLIGVARLDADGETPAHAGEITRICAEQVESVEGDVVGEVTEADVTRALNELDAAGLVTRTERDSTSPVGKGRPAYEASLTAAELADAFGDDDRLQRLL